MSLSCSKSKVYGICRLYSLRANYHKSLKQQMISLSTTTSTHSHTNERWLTSTIQKKENSSKLKLRISNTIKCKIKELHDRMVIDLDGDLHCGLVKVMEPTQHAEIKSTEVLYYRKLVFITCFGASDSK